jgi:hypothetical protein
MTAITLPSLPIGKDYYYEVMSYDDIRTRDLEVARLVLEGAAKVAELSHPDDWAFIGATIRNLEVNHHE